MEVELGDALEMTASRGIHSSRMQQAVPGYFLPFSWRAFERALVNLGEPRVYPISMSANFELPLCRVSSFQTYAESITVTRSMS